MGSKDMLDDKDLHLFRTATRDAIPLAQDRIDPHRRRRSTQPQQTRHDEALILAELLISGPEPDEPENSEELWYARPGVPESTVRKLRQGRYSVAADLDLHGMTVPEARVALARFLVWATRLRSRCVRIIHGKGRRSPNGPVLKRNVVRWLQRRDEVLALASTRRFHGGTGALYVLLRRSRPC